MIFTVFALRCVQCLLTGGNLTRKVTAIRRYVMCVLALITYLTHTMRLAFKIAVQLKLCFIKRTGEGAAGISCVLIRCC